MMANIGLPHSVQSTCLEKFKNCAFSARIRSKLGPKWTLIKVESRVINIGWNLF